jgi:hypothetical protein
MVDIIKTPLRYFVSLDSTGAPANYQREYQQRVEDNGVELFPPQIKVEDISATEFEAFFNNASVTLSATVAELNAANVVLKTERDAAFAMAESLKQKAMDAIAAAQPLVQAVGD